jgi:uncharacterized membrane protein (DUF373 family)
MERWFAKGTILFEQITTVLLAIIALLGIASFLSNLVLDFSLNKKHVTEWVDFALLLFVIIELMRIALAYLREVELLPVVFEAVIVAIARKLVAFDTEQADYLTKAFALATLFVATAVSWGILRKSRALPDSAKD